MYAVRFLLIQVNICVETLENMATIDPGARGSDLGGGERGEYPDGMGGLWSQGRGGFVEGNCRGSCHSFH